LKLPSATIPDIDINLHLRASISGHVYQSDGKAPLADAHVNSEEYCPGISLLEGYDTNANSDGYYIFEGLRPGSFVINAVTPGFARRWYDSKPSSCNVDQLKRRTFSETGFLFIWRLPLSIGQTRLSSGSLYSNCKPSQIPRVVTPGFNSPPQDRNDLSFCPSLFSHLGLFVSSQNFGGSGS